MRKLIKYITFHMLYPLLKVIPMKKRYVLFNNNNGKTFDDNTRAIYEELNSQYGNQLKYIVTINDKEKIRSSTIIKVKYMGFKYLYYLATSKYWIINVNMYSGITPRHGQKYVQTWHGTPLKKIGSDIESQDVKMTNEWLNDAKHWDYFISNSTVSNSNYKSAFSLKDEQIITVGLPRNDLLESNVFKRNEFIKKYKIANDSKILLYAPTFRDNIKEYPINFDEISKMLGDEYCLLVQFHRLFQGNKVPNYKNIIFNNVLSVDVCMEISDCLITDYSSLFFDYSMMDKPMYFFPFDYDEYKNKERGFYYDYLDFVPGPIFYDAISLFGNIVDVGIEKKLDIKEFSSRFNQNYDKRNATKKVVDIVFKKDLK